MVDVEGSWDCLCRKHLHQNSTCAINLLICDVLFWHVITRFLLNVKVNLESKILKYNKFCGFYWTLETFELPILLT